MEQRIISTQHLGEALRAPVAEVRASLNALIAEGLVHRTGHAKTTRYHA